METTDILPPNILSLSLFPQCHHGTPPFSSSSTTKGKQRTSKRKEDLRKTPWETHSKNLLLSLRSSSLTSSTLSSPSLSFACTSTPFPSHSPHLIRSPKIPLLSPPPPPPPFLLLQQKMKGKVLKSPATTPMASGSQTNWVHYTTTPAVAPLKKDETA